MGQLPGERVTPTRPFTNSGVDCWTLLYKTRRPTQQNNNKTLQCSFYMSVYKSISPGISTRSIHEVYIAALQRFVARRGLCNNIYCDNGTNFVGAEEIKRMMLDKESVDKISNYASQQGIKFHFVPPVPLTWVASGKQE
jgi:hypothetical protein